MMFPLGVHCNLKPGTITPKPWWLNVNKNKKSFECIEIFPKLRSKGLNYKKIMETQRNLTMFNSIKWLKAKKVF